MDLQVALQFAQLVAIVAGFGVSIAVNRNDTKWVIKSLDEHRAEDNRRFDEIKSEIRGNR